MSACCAHNPLQRCRAPRATPREISLERIQAVYQYPITTAAARLNVGVTVLKRYCRWYSIERWPYRKIQSVNRLIEQLSQLAAEDVAAEAVVTEVGFLCCLLTSCPFLVFLRKNFAQVKTEVESIRAQIYQNPATDLDQKLLRLRQAKYKYEMKQRQQ